MGIRERALELLGSGETFSGERLARELGVSRNAVWKVMNQLRQDGYGIDAVTEAFVNGDSLEKTFGIRYADYYTAATEYFAQKYGDLMSAD